MQTKTCPYCGEEINVNAIKCKHCGEFLNSSEPHRGSSQMKEFPEELKKFNWGACLITWIWGIGNNVNIALWGLASILLFIPVIGIFIAVALLIFQIWLGINGNKLAWQSKQWSSVEQFNTVQKKWAMWSAIVMFGLPLIIGFLAGFIQGFNNGISGY